MANEIFRPPRLQALVRDENGAIEKVPITSLGVGWAVFNWGSYKKGNLVGLEAHGSKIAIELELISQNEGEVKVQWQDISFNFTIFHLWLRGLSLEERETLIADVLSWQEEAHIRALQEDTPLKKVA